MLQPVEKALAGFREFRGFGSGFTRLQHIDVRPGDERAGFAADEHDAPEAGVLFQVIQQRVGFIDEFGFQRVLAFAGQVDGDDCDVVFASRQLENGQIQSSSHGLSPPNVTRLPAPALRPIHPQRRQSPIPARRRVGAVH